ncbi:MAG TPA: disulfide bond formation protein B [Chlamydiales bacterium]|jgi:disulfide bond formation protein DsbB
MTFFHRYALYFAWLISLVGLLLSLYFGEVLKWEMCRLCWYQRIALFPLALLLGIAAYKGDRHIAPYALVLCAAGGLVALYQVLEQRFPILRTSAICGYTHDCSRTLFELFGFLTFPMISATGFFLIGTLLCLTLHPKE